MSKKPNSPSDPFNPAHGAEDEDMLDFTTEHGSQAIVVAGGRNLPARPAGQKNSVARSIPGENDLSGQGITRRAGAVDNFQDGDASFDASRGRIGERLVALGLITQDQLIVALQEKKMTGKMLGQVLVSLGFIDESTLSRFLAEASGFEVFDQKKTIFDGDALNLLTKEDALKYNALPVAFNEGTAVFAVVDPYDVVTMDMLKRLVPKGTQIKTLVTTPSLFNDAVSAAYGYAVDIQGIIAQLEQSADSADTKGLEDDGNYTHPIIRLVNAFLMEGVKMGASDIHFEPEETFMRLRYRLDGVLFTSQIVHKKYFNAISQRLKIMANLNIADKISPQDGRINLSMAGKEVDFRVSSLPTVFGENIVLRILDKSASIMPLTKLGFSDENLKKIKRAQARPEGIIIVTGPTGSGKSTSLYSMINEMNNVEVNIQTLEDPVEYSLPMIRQTHVREGILDFADGIKALLRQDPDIIFIGEIRDSTTGEMALKAAMTGHQVYTTLHTNDSFGAIPRLVDLGLKPGMIAGAIIAIFAQRLVRRLCGQCKEAYTPDAEECAALKLDPQNPPQIYRARQGGCQACSGQGYKGRLAVAEILLLDDDLDEMIAAGANKVELKRAAKQKGFKSMKDDGILKVLEGHTSVHELSGTVDMQKD
jgi:type IV pilus assembly protein PilB